jgi:hypothetical protein
VNPTTVQLADVVGSTVTILNDSHRCSDFLLLPTSPLELTAPDKTPSRTLHYTAAYELPQDSPLPPDFPKVHIFGRSEWTQCRGVIGAVLQTIAERKTVSADRFAALRRHFERRFPVNEQHDAHEFYTVLITQIHQPPPAKYGCGSEYRLGPLGAAHDFYGALQCEVRCVTCGTVVTVIEVAFP